MLLKFPINILNIMTNAIGIKLAFAFTQTSPIKEVQEFMLRSKEISKKHSKLFVDTLLNDDIETPHLPDVAVSDSTMQTFSDKLMMFQRLIQNRSAWMPKG